MASVIEKREKLNYSVHELTPEMYHDISGLFETLRNLTDSPEIPSNMMPHYIQEGRSRRHHVFVAALPTLRVIGTGQISYIPTLTHYDKKRNQLTYKGHIEDVATHPDYEGNGVGGSVIEQIIAHAENQGDVYKLTLDCDTDNIEWYTKRGFVHDPEEIGNFMRRDIERRIT